ERMAAVFQQQLDIHTATAAAVMGKAPAEVTKADRQAAKCLVYGLLYGMGADTLREYAQTNYGVALTPAEAQRFRMRFFQTYQGLWRWHRRQPNGAIETRSLGGRRRLAVEKFTKKLNTPVQSTGADGLKTALALLVERRAECPSARIVLCVHDEI